MAEREADTSKKRSFSVAFKLKVVAAAWMMMKTNVSQITHGRFQFRSIPNIYDSVHVLQVRLVVNDLNNE